MIIRKATMEDLRDATDVEAVCFQKLKQQRKKILLAD